MKRNSRHWADKLTAKDIHRIIKHFEECEAYAKPLADKKRELWIIAQKRAAYMQEFWRNMLVVQQNNESIVPHLRTLRNITWCADERTES